MPLSIPNHLEQLLKKPVAVFGGGLSGTSVAELLGRFGAKSVIYDEKAQAGERRSFLPADVSQHQLVVFSPGFRVQHPWLTTAAAGGCVCLGELDFASLLWNGRVLAITGTNGKTTLTEFLTHALRNTGCQAWSTGNIGFSFSRLVNETDGGTSDSIAVCEVSSFQSEILCHFQADSLIWTNFAEDHLERHPGLGAYFAAKYQLLQRSNPQATFVGSSVARYAESLRFFIPSEVCVSTEGQAPDAGLAGTVFETYPQRENFILARALWLQSGRDEKTLYAAAATFKLGRHRLACVARIRDVEYWNDSKATNFHAVEAALSSFNKPVLLIAGGKAKGGNLQDFIRRISPRVQHVFLIGETKAILAEACREHRTPHTVCLTLDEAVLKASELSQPGDKILLSPGFASFDMFRGYDHRGEIFEQLVHGIAGTIAATT